MEESQMQIQEKTAVEETADDEADDQDSAIDLSKEIDELSKLQITLENMMGCPRSPSTSVASSGRDTGSSGRDTGAYTSGDKEEPKKITGLIARRLIRVPCPSSSRSASPECMPLKTLSNLPFTVHGGAASARLILIDIVRRHDLIGVLAPNDIVLMIEDISVSGMLLSEVNILLNKLCREKEQIAIEVVPAGSIPDEICDILADKQWLELHVVIRDNLYRKTVPYTTRPAREGEIDGEHYRFVSVEEFTQLQNQGFLLEHGTYQDHLYGTPRPVECYEDEMVSSAAKGPLPPNWEIGYLDNGDKYFIDHNSATTTWDDPRDLPVGWEQVDDPDYGTFFVDHINKKTQYERPCLTQPLHSYDTLPSTASYQHHNGIIVNDTATNYSPSHQSRRINGGTANGCNSLFTKDPSQLRGEIITTTIIKGPKGLGFTLIGNDASSKGDEFIQVKSVLPGGPAAENGVLRPGDVIVRVNGELLLGASQADACRIFVGIPIKDPVTIQICRGYPLMLDPSNRIITENVYTTGGRSRDLHEIEISKGTEGFGFTIADSVSGQRVKKILYPAQCPNLMEGDTIVELDGRNVRATPHTQLVDMLRECSVGHRGRLVVKRSSPKHRSRTPTAAFRYGEQRSTPAPSVIPRSKTPAPTQKQSSEQMSNGIRQTCSRPTTLQRQSNVPTSVDVWDGSSRIRPSSTSLGFATPNYMPLSAFQLNRPSDLITINLLRKPSGFGFRLLGGRETNTLLTVGQIVPGGAAAEDGRMAEGDEIIEIDGRRVEGVSHAEAVSLLEHAAQVKHVKMVVRRPRTERPLSSVSNEYDVILNRTDSDGFGFIIISSLSRNGSTIGQILDNSPAFRCARLKVGDRVVAVNGIDILNLSHGEIVSLIKASGLSVRLTISPPLGPENIPIASSTLNNRVSIPNLYAPVPPTAFNGSAGCSSNANYATYTSAPTSTTFSYTNGTISKSPAHYSPYEELSRPNYISHHNGNIGGVVYNESIQPEQGDPLMTVELERGVRGFGFSIRGGHEFGAMPLFVLRVAEDGPASRDGRLRVGDQLISINGRDTKGLTHEEAIQLIKQHPTVRLMVRRHKLP